MQTSALFSPLQMRGLRLENRIVVSPMCQYSATDGTACDWHVVNLGHLALCGPGLTFFEATHVSPEGRITPSCLGLYHDENEAAIARVVAFLRTWTRTKIGVQLAHAGRKASTLPPWQGGGPVTGARGWTPVAPSAIPYDERAAVPRALDAAGLKKVVADFRAATSRCVRLAIDAIELHFAHGYLAHEFLSPLSNHRTDEYGGSLENRMRFPLALFDAVRAAWPAERPLGVRISATDYVEGGWHLAEAIVFAQELRRRGCDFVDCSSGGLSPHQKISPEPGYQVAFARDVKRAAEIATIAIGMITDPREAERIVAGGDADMVALARGFLRDPRWVWDAADALGGESFVPDQYARARRTSLPPSTDRR
ncbi:MAG TPA: NADH:flavin oxidoreductase/NADH oxidase [Candidatus Acidoferrales bacterium]|nr:NADH:flavin oxidoreductase/NADH oxidase [Candidatus Acidoferrales bacterium]